MKESLTAVSENLPDNPIENDNSTNTQDHPAACDCHDCMRRLAKALIHDALDHQSKVRLREFLRSAEPFVHAEFAAARHEAEEQQGNNPQSDEKEPNK